MQKQQVIEKIKSYDTLKILRFHPCNDKKPSYIFIIRMPKGF